MALYPQLGDEIDAIISEFIESPEGRMKKKVPSLGEFLPLLSVSRKYNWRDVGLAYFQEHLDR